MAFSVPLGSKAVEITTGITVGGAAAIVKLRFCELVAFKLSVTVKIRLLYAPAAVGLPESVPVLSNVRPAGKVPFNDQP